MEKHLLRSARVALRAGEDRDAPALFAMFSDPETVRYWSSTPWTDLESARLMLARDRAAHDADQAMRWMIVAPAEGAADRGL